MGFETLILEKKGSVAVITLHRPERMNAINSQFMKELALALSEVEEAPGIRALVLTGGEKVFAAGADIGEINGLDTAARVHGFVQAIQRAFGALAAMEIPTIAAVAGIAFGGGFELALACDFRIAAESAKFALPEINLGLIPGAGGTQRLPRLIGTARALEMIATGAPIDAQKALDFGVVSRMVQDKELMAEALRFAETLSGKPALALDAVRNLVTQGVELNLAAALAYEARCFEMLFSTEDKKEGTAAFMEKRKPQFTGR